VSPVRRCAGSFGFRTSFFRAAAAPPRTLLPLRPDDLEAARARGCKEREVMSGEDEALELLAPPHGGHGAENRSRARVRSTSTSASALVTP